MLTYVQDLSRDTTTEDGIESDTVAVKSHAITPIRAAQAALKSFHSGLVDCDLLKFLCISDHLPEKPQGAKGQPQLPAKKVTAQASDGSVVSGIFCMSFGISCYTNMP
jgi:hypothetical protein